MCDGTPASGRIPGTEVDRPPAHVARVDPVRLERGPVPANTVHAVGPGQNEEIARERRCIRLPESRAVQPKEPRVWRYQTDAEDAGKVQRQRDRTAVRVRPGHLPVVRRDDQARERPVPVILRHLNNGAKAKKGRDLGAVTVGVESPEPIGIIGIERAVAPDEQRTRPVMARVVGPGGIDRRAVWRYAKDLGPNIVTAGEDGPVRRDRQRTQ